ncbi:MAG: HDOD domain-containing protein [Planctomycetota bacterium]|nr:HDOD domain-containing protein [Planctomycetaceae bacterium]MDQ3330196.1 HDOD domain-containing protein [Planctomycetota bacterium]
MSPDTAFLLGLIQDIGIAVIANATGERYARSVGRVQHVPQLLLHNVERSEFGHTHADVSAALLQKWEMPASLVDPVLAHHGGNVPPSKVGQGFVRVMRIGEAIADLADSQCPQQRNVLNDLLAGYSSDKQRRCTEAMAEGVARAVEATALLRLPVPKPQSMLLLADELQTVHDGELVVIA